MVQGESVEDDKATKPRPQFKVTDRRHFTVDGELRADLPEESDDATKRTSRPVPDGQKAEGAGVQRRSLAGPEGVDFTMLINAMAQPALLFLGEIPHPATGKADVDLEQARIQIDMIDLLRVKCRGNLSPQEEDLLER